MGRAVLPASVAVTLSTTELHQRLGVSNNTLNRLAARGILQPARVADSGYRGYAFRWTRREARAAQAVVSLVRSHLLAGSQNHDLDALHAVATEARRHEVSPVNRWLVLTADGRCHAAGDWLACAIAGPRTLIELVQP